MRKLVQLHKREASLTPEAFQTALASACQLDPSIDGLVAYVQSHTLPGGYRKGEPLFDAMEEFTFADEQDVQAFMASEAAAAIAASRAPIVDAPQGHSMIVQIHRIKDLPVPQGGVKNIEFVNRRPGMELAPFRAYWREKHGPLASHIPSILRYEQNHLAMSGYADGAEPRYDGLAITWFSSTDAMRDGSKTEAYAATRADEPNFLPDGHLPIIIVKEVLFR